MEHYLAAGAYEHNMQNLCHIYANICPQDMQICLPSREPLGTNIRVYGTLLCLPRLRFCRMSRLPRDLSQLILQRQLKTAQVPARRSV